MNLFSFPSVSSFSSVARKQRNIIRPPVIISRRFGVSSDENYCFFAFKDVDWDEVHDRYNLLVKDTMDQYELFDILGKMLAR